MNYLFPSDPKKIKANTMDGTQCFLTKMLNADCFLSLDKDTITDRHGEFLNNRGVNIKTPSEVLLDLERTHKNLYYLI